MLRQEREHSPTGSVSRSRLPAYCAMKSTIASRMNNADALKDAIKWARDTPIELILKSGNRFSIVHLDYHDGLRYPHLERDLSQPGRLDDILAAKE